MRLKTNSGNNVTQWPITVQDMKQGHDINELSIVTPQDQWNSRLHYTVDDVQMTFFHQTLKGKTSPSWKREKKKDVSKFSSY